MLLHLALHVEYRMHTSLALAWFLLQQWYAELSVTLVNNQMSGTQYGIASQSNTLWSLDIVVPWFHIRFALSAGLVRGLLNYD